MYGKMIALLLSAVVSLQVYHYDILHKIFWALVGIFFRFIIKYYVRFEQYLEELGNLEMPIETPVIEELPELGLMDVWFWSWITPLGTYLANGYENRFGRTSTTATCVILITLVVLAFSFMVLAYKICRKMGGYVINTYVIKYARYTLLGIQHEAMVMGSGFVQARIPDCQVALHSVGMFGTTHVGYGLRYKNVLIVPNHVVSRYREMVLVNDTVKKLVDVSKKQDSAAVTDLAYIYVPKALWADLKVRSMTHTKAETKAMVSCCGLEGASTGGMMPTINRGVVYYSGSTKPGFSGAAYTIGNRVMGMHIGAATNVNAGIHSSIFMLEVDSMVFPESQGDDYQTEDVAMRLTDVGATGGWDYDGIYETFKTGSKFKDTSEYSTMPRWADMESLVGECKVTELAKQLAKLPKPQREALTQATKTAAEIDSLKNVGMQLVGQSPTGDHVHLVSSVPEAGPSGENIGTIVRRHEQQIRELEKFCRETCKYVNFTYKICRGLHDIMRSKHPEIPKWETQKQEKNPLEYPIKNPVEIGTVPEATIKMVTLVPESTADTPNPHKCAHCARSFHGMEALNQHILAKHGIPVEPEATHSSDLRKTVKTTAFLGQTRAPRQRKSKLLKAVSSSTENQNQSPSLAANQSEVTSSIQEMQKSLASLQAAMVGLSSAIMRN